MLTNREFKEFYIKGPDNTRYVEGQLEENSPIGIIINKITMILLTSPGEILGQPLLGAGLKFYLWETAIDVDGIAQILIEQFDEYIPEMGEQGYPYSMKLQIIPGDPSAQDMLLVDIKVQDNNGEDYQLNAVI